MLEDESESSGSMLWLDVLHHIFLKAFNLDRYPHILNVIEWSTGKSIPVVVGTHTSHHQEAYVLDLWQWKGLHGRARHQLVLFIYPQSTALGLRGEGGEVQHI